MDGKKHIETLYFEDDSSVSSDIFKNLFYGHTILDLVAINVRINLYNIQGIYLPKAKA